MRRWMKNGENNKFYSPFQTRTLMYKTTVIQDARQAIHSTFARPGIRTEAVATGYLAACANTGENLSKTATAGLQHVEPRLSR